MGSGDVGMRISALTLAQSRRGNVVLSRQTGKKMPKQIPKGTHRPLSSSFLGLPYRILNINDEKELLGGLWVDR